MDARDVVPTLLVVRDLLQRVGPLEQLIVASPRPSPRYVVVMENASRSRPMRSGAGAMCVLFKLLKSG